MASTYRLPNRRSYRTFSRSCARPYRRFGRKRRSYSAVASTKEALRPVVAGGVPTAILKRGYVLVFDKTPSVSRPYKLFRVTIKSGVNPIIRFMKRHPNSANLSLLAHDQPSTQYYSDLVKNGLSSAT
jgi:hypothetical protein